jgi:AAA15 family ATPase/GTPase
VYRSFEIRNFRCFRDLTIGNLAHINLIAGKNNVGKTTLLETIWLHQGYFNPELGVRLRQMRGLNSRVKREEVLNDLFTDFDRDRTIELMGEYDNGENRTLQISVNQASSYKLSLGDQAKDKEQDSLSGEIDQETTTSAQTEIRFHTKGKADAYAYVDIDEVRFQPAKGIEEPISIYLAARRPESQAILSRRLGNVEVNKQTNLIIQALKVVESRLRRILVRYELDNPVIYGDIGTDRLVPLPLMGDGLGRLLGISLAIVEAKNGVLLVDEIENGLHYSVMENVWRAIADLAIAYNVQIFATTHSHECALAAYQALVDKNLDFAFHRLEETKKEEIVAVTYDIDMLEAAFELDAEVR